MNYMNYMKVTLSIIIIITFLVGCTTSQPKQPLAPNSSFAGTSIEKVSSTFRDSVTASNLLGYNLLINMQEGENTLLSPISLSMALAMAYNAASSDTAANIAQTMGDEDPTLINPHYNALIAHLNREHDSDKIQIGNSFWIRDTLEAKQTFVDVLSKDFNADIHSADFADKNTINIMNTWVEDKTNGLLKDTIKEIDPLTIAYLMNTVYFKGKWLDAFSEDATLSLPFYLADGSTRPVPMMSQTKSFQYAENDVVQVAAFPYKDNTRMVIYLPKESLNDLIKSHNYNDLAMLTSDEQMINRRLSVSMPKFEYSVSNPLKNALVEMGLTLPFDNEKADFSNMIEIKNENVFISDVFQNAKIINDEGGTEAAAVTVVEFGVTSMPMVDEPIVFNCNKPFFYVIEDITTGAALFMGTYLGK